MRSTVLMQRSHGQHNLLASTCLDDLQTHRIHFHAGHQLTGIMSPAGAEPEPEPAGRTDLPAFPLTSPVHLQECVSMVLAGLTIISRRMHVEAMLMPPALERFLSRRPALQAPIGHDT